MGTSSSNTFDFSATALLNIASIDAGAGNDNVTGSQESDVIIGGLGNDTLSGGGGDDNYLFALGDGRDAIHNNDLDQIVTTN